MPHSKYLINATICKPVGRRECRAFGPFATCVIGSYAKEVDVDSGELSPRMFGDYHATCERICDKSARRDWSQTWPPRETASRVCQTATGWANGVAGSIRFKYGYDAGLIQQPIRFGPGFKTPSKAKLRKERQAKPLDI
jgi:hypothetical protein